jgi:hypothetical protein
VRFQVLPRRRWVVERTLTWITRCSRTVRDYERLPGHHETYGPLGWSARPATCGGRGADVAAVTADVTDAGAPQRLIDIALERHSLAASLPFLSVDAGRAARQVANAVAGGHPDPGWPGRGAGGRRRAGPDRCGAARRQPAGAPRSGRAAGRRRLREAAAPGHQRGGVRLADRLGRRAARDLNQDTTPVP